MNKVNQSLTKSVNKLLVNVGVKVLSYEEVNQEIQEITPEMHESMEKMKAFHNNAMDLIGVDDNSLHDSTELVLHELVHMAFSSSRLNIQFGMTEEGKQTEDAAAQMGIFKILAALNLNPALYEHAFWSYIKTLPEANLIKADKYAGVATNYLMGFVKN